jgi:hypothetical protein
MDARPDPANGVSLDAWLAILRAVPELAAVEVTRDEQRALLDLTRVAAHRSERVAAPITAYLVGLVMASADPTRRAERIRALADALDPDERGDPAGQAPGPGASSPGA